MPKVTFQYEDGTSTIVDVTAGENLLEVARKANVAIAESDISVAN